MSASRRICIIGNSSIGAVRLALNDRSSLDRYIFSFFGSGGPKFDAMEISGDHLVGAEVESGGDRDLSAYDGFVLHGRFPAAFEALDFERNLSPDRYSANVRALARKDWRNRYKSWGMGLALHARYGKPVLAVPRNVFASECAGARAERAEADEAMSRFVAPLRFVALPDALFDDSGRVLQSFYSKYVNVHGHESRASTNDEWHYNREAGALILDKLIAGLDAAFG
jgi:hypothetical protein